MLEAYAAASGVGVLLGFRYRVPAALAASALLVIAGAAVGQFAGWSPWVGFVTAGGAVLALQCGYLAGLLLACGASRAGLWPRAVRPPSNPC